MAYKDFTVKLKEDTSVYEEHWVYKGHCLLGAIGHYHVTKHFMVLSASDEIVAEMSTNNYANNYADYFEQAFEILDKEYEKERYDKVSL